MKLDRLIAVGNSKSVYRDGDLCVKVFNAEYSKADVLNEALNQARIEETGLNIPKILEVTTVDGRWAIVSEYIKGKTLAQLMAAEPEKADEYMELFVDLQLDVHAQSCPHLNKLRDKLVGKIAESEFEATTRYDLHSRLEEMPKSYKICHGDFNLSNVVITKSGVPYILDWSHATQGNVLADAARTYLLFCMNGDTAGAGRYLDCYCAKSGADGAQIRKWMPMVAASLSIKGSEKEREFFRTWVSRNDR